jgi:hypothetical protein
VKPWLALAGYDSRRTLTTCSYENQSGIGAPFQAMSYIPEQDIYQPVDEIPKGTVTADISGTEPIASSSLNWVTSSCASYGP